MLNLAGVAIDAVSVGGLETCIQLPGFDLAFDIGRCPPSAVHRSHVLFTHAHIDHMGSAVHHCATRSLTHLPPPTYLMPRENIEAFEDMLACWRRLDHSDLACKTVGMSPGDSYTLRPGVIATTFRAPHTVPCLGYCIWESKKKLKKKYLSKTGPELRDLKNNGVEITNEVRAPIVAFTGDSLIEIVDREEAVRTARVLIMEVTFVDDRISPEQARSKGHIHIEEVFERADLFENRLILFTHLSARYKTQEAQAVLDKRLPAALKDRVHLLGNDRS